MTRMAVLDFETANHQPGSACQLGIVMVEPWRIVSEHQWLIRPQRMFFSPRCVAVHGITPRDVLDSPTWDQIWSEVAPLLDEAVVIAHNAGFDAKVLSSTCQIYDIAMHPVDLQCTRLISKRTFTSLRSHALANVAEHLEVQFRHHDALEDARTSATILMRAAERAGAEDLDQLEDRLGLIRGRVWTDRIRQPRTVRRSRMESIVAEPEPRYEPRSFRIDGVPTRSAAIRQSRLRADEILSHSKDAKPLSGKNVVLIHNLLGLDREDSLSFLSQLGATVQSHLNLQTNYLILGVPSATDGPSENGSSTTFSLARDTNPIDRNLEEVSRRQNEGQPVRVISQRQLLAMIPSGLATARGDV